MFHCGKRRKGYIRTQALGSVMLLVLPLASRAETAQPVAQRSVSATLYISVTMVPVVQTSTHVPPAHASGSITYRMEAKPLAETYEVRGIVAEEQNGRSKCPAVLKTLVVVAQ